MPRLAEKLDFTIGEEFEEEVCSRFGAQVHHAYPRSQGSFLLLATFHHSLVRLSEESVSLILKSCLGGDAPFFHVVEVSHNHFWFSVSCKGVGFHIYRLRRVIGSVFDVYFHLWSNGAPHWEREKRLWEEEEAKRWSLVLSKNQKRAAKKANQKKLRFAQNLVLCSPKVKSVPLESRPRIHFGSLDLDFLSVSLGSSSGPLGYDHGILKSSGSSDYIFPLDSDGSGLPASDDLPPGSKALNVQEEQSDAPQQQSTSFQNI